MKFSSRWLGLTIAFLGCSRGPNDEAEWAIGEARATYKSSKSLVRDVNTLGDLQAYVPLGVRRFVLSASARDSLVIGANAKIVTWQPPEDDREYGTVSSMGTLTIGKNAVVGSVYAYGPSPVSLGPGVAIHGFVKTSAAVEGLQWSRVETGVLEHVEGQIEAYYWQLKPPLIEHGAQVSRSSDQYPLDLQPGSFSELRVEGRSTTVIHSGIYFFESLSVDAGGTLEIDNAAGPVYIWIRDNFGMLGAMRDEMVEPNILIGYVGTRAASIGAPFRATLVAPNSIVNLPACTEPHSGSFFARSIVLAPGAVLEGRGFLINVMEPLNPALICNGCAVHARSVGRECCDAIDLLGLESDNDRTNCVASCSADRPGNLCRASCLAEAVNSRRTLKPASGLCADRIWQGYAQCLLGNRYRPTTCLRMGYPGLGKASCEDAVLLPTQEE